MRDFAVFLLARFAEDEAVQRGRDTWHEHSCGVNDDMGPTDCDCGVPARMLAECGAKRRIVEWVTDNADPYDMECGGDLAREVLTRLALPYADHPDYRAEWRPDA